MADRPHIRFEPGIRWGEASIQGIPVDAIAGMVMAGESIPDVAADYDITVHEVFLACWYEGLHGDYRSQWSEWAAGIHPALAGFRPFNPDEEPWPPDQHELGGA